jgi:hypothetical protein
MVSLDGKEYNHINMSTNSILPAAVIRFQLIRLLGLSSGRNDGYGDYLKKERGRLYSRPRTCFWDQRYFC